MESSESIKWLHYNLCCSESHLLHYVMFFYGKAEWGRAFGTKPFPTSGNTEPAYYIMLPYGKKCQCNYYLEQNLFGGLHISNSNCQKHLFIKYRHTFFLHSEHSRTANTKLNSQVRSCTGKQLNSSVPIAHQKSSYLGPTTSSRQVGCSGGI